MRLIENGYDGADTEIRARRASVDVIVTPTWFGSRFAADAFTLAVTSCRSGRTCR